MCILWESINNIVYRIPVIIKTKNNILLAFSEKRYNGLGDSGKIKIVLKKSFDKGYNWKNEKVVWEDGDNTCGNPCPIVDKSGTIHLLMTWNEGKANEKGIMKGKWKRIPYYTKSEDDGETWIRPKIIEGKYKDWNWGWYATGPGNGIQLDNGRLIAPCNHSTMYNSCKSPYKSHLLYSDNNGKTWEKSISQPEYTNESSVIELKNGDIAHIMRLQNKKKRCIGISKDKGETWENTYIDKNLISSICQGSSIRFNDWYLISVPIDEYREKLTIYFSKDLENWKKKIIYLGSSAYSNLVKLDDNNIGIIYERDNYNRIVFEKISFDSLFEKDKPEYKWSIENFEFPEDINLYLSQVSKYWTQNSMWTIINIDDINYYVHFDKMKLYSLNNNYMFDNKLSNIIKIKLYKNK